MRCPPHMTTEDYHEEGETECTLDDLYTVAVSIEEKVEEILDELKELVASGRESSMRGLDLRDSYDDLMD